MDAPLLVVGFPRSGTTLLWAMLDLHPDLAVVPEWRFVPELLRPDADGTLRTGRAALQELLDHPRVRRDGLDPRLALARFEALRVADTPAEGLRAAFEAWAEQQGKVRWGHKNPEDLPHIDALATAFPDARFVHLIRDARAVADSHRSVRFATNHLTVAAQQWTDWVAAGRAAGQRLGERYLEVRYEALVADPAKVLQAICAHADLDFDEVMVDQRRRVPTAEGLPDHHLGIAQPVTQGLRDWRTRWSDDERRAVEVIAGALLQELGYERSVEPPDPAVERRIRRRLRRTAAWAGVWRAAGRRWRRLRPLARRLW